ncbi:MAG: SDR family oxidoreductase [Bacteroidota bacterium]
MQYALVTGAAKGIGKAIAAELAARNYNLLLVDIDEKKLTKTEKEFNIRFKQTVHSLHLDLSAKYAAEEIFYWSKPFHKSLNVVVNNAGYGLNGSFENISLEEQLNIIDVNVKAQLKISHSFIPVLKRLPEAYLLNVGSTTCYQSVPYLSVYAASKAFVISFSRSLRYELRNTNISVSCLSPGSTDTDFVNRARMSEQIKKTANRFNMTPEAVAKIAVKGLFNGKSEIIPGFTNKLNAFLPKFFPKSFVEKIAGNIYENKKEIKLLDTKILLAAGD